MAHYNIYSDLEIDRSLPSSEIVGIIDQRLAQTAPTDTSELDRLRTSRDLFSDDSRRLAYDRALDTPGSPDISISQFREFAQGSLGSSTSMQPETANPWAQQQPATTHSAVRKDSEPAFQIRSLAVSPDRRRSESLMWLIGLGTIVVSWIYVLFTILFDNSSDQQYGGLFGDLPNMDAIQATAFAAMHTVAMLVLLQFLWNLRMYIGRVTK